MEKSKYCSATQCAPRDMATWATHLQGSWRAQGLEGIKPLQPRDGVIGPSAEVGTSCSMPRILFRLALCSDPWAALR